MSRLVKLMVFGLLFLGLFVSAQDDCSKAHYTQFDSAWLCVETVYSPTTYTFYGQFYLYEGEYGDYPTWHIVVKSISSGPEKPIELECWHDTYFGGSDYSGSSVPVNQFLSDWTPTTHPWTHCLNINSNFVLYATAVVPEGSQASVDPLWYNSGCPNIYYDEYDGGLPSMPKVKLIPTWASAKQSPSQVSAPVSSSKKSAPVFVRSSVSKVSSVLSKAGSYFRQRAFKR